MSDEQVQDTPVQEAPKPPPLPLEKILGDTLAALVRLPYPPPGEVRDRLRGMILAKCNIWIPDEPPPDIGAFVQENHKAPPPKPPVPSRNGETAFIVNGEYTRVETGTATFRQTANYSGRYEVSEETVREILDEAEDFDDAVEKLEEIVWDNDDFDCQGTYDTEYDDETVDNHEERDDESTDARRRLRDYLNTHPELDPDREEEEYNEGEYGDDNDDDDDEDDDDDDDDNDDEREE
jgi:hypothetical protein